jgi:hypothetical protein
MHKRPELSRQQRNYKGGVRTQADSLSSASRRGDRGEQIKIILRVRPNILLMNCIFRVDEFSPKGPQESFLM